MPDDSGFLIKNDSRTVYANHKEESWVLSPLSNQTIINRLLKVCRQFNYVYECNLCLFTFDCIFGALNAVL